MICVQSGTTATGNFDAVPEGWVVAPNPLPHHPIWDDGLGNIREKNNAEHCADARAEKIAETKGEAARRIFTQYPQTAQTNLQANASLVTTLCVYMVAEGLLKKSVTHALAPAWDAVGGSLPSDARDIIAAAVQAMLGDIKPIRDASDLIEADIIALGDDLDAIKAFDVLGSARWPA